MSSQGSEKSIVKRIKAQMLRAKPQSKWVKIVGGPYQEVGLPDLLGTVAGRTVAVEVKTPQAFDKAKHNLSAGQLKCLAEYKQAGATVYVTDGHRWEEFDEAPCSNPADA